MKNQLENNESYLGFTDDKTALQKAKIEKCLDKVFRYEDGIMARKDKVLNDLRIGRRPEIADVATGNGKIKKEYRMAWDRFCYEITKTEYDFCFYLIEHDLVSAESVDAFIEAEKLKRKRFAEEQRKAEEAARKEKERAEAERKEFKTWLYENAKMYENTTIGNLIERVYLSIYEEFSHPYGAYCLAVSINNIEKPLCREDLKARLHKDNRASRKVFECITGLKLPKTNKETMEFLDSLQRSDYKGMVEFKERKKPKKQPEKEQEQFYVLMNKYGNGMEFVPKMGEKITYKGIDMFIHNTLDNKIAISSVECGLRIATGENKTEVTKKMKELFEKLSVEEIQAEINEAVSSYGVSPYLK